MGIPSYFSYIIKNYSNIIRKQSGCEKIQQLLMDCNSIIYDSYRELEEKYKKEPFDLNTIESQIIQKTIDKIVEYIMIISPEKSTFVTFDGVAPLAKMDQQRVRRFKTRHFVSFTSPPIWDTTSITPGTTFMMNLSNSVKTYFEKNQIPNIRVFTSCSDEIGEGEHKLFHMVRTTDCKNDTIAVYGLDADLIMLSIFHQRFCKNIYVFRESPTFKTVISSQFDEKELLFMDINGLSNSIFQEMGKYDPADKEMRVTDYVFMCFFLGNDFLPHLVALNIRTTGIQKLTDTYYQTIGKFRDRSLIHPIKKNLNWKCIKIFISSLAKNEHAFILKEYEIRERWDNKKWSLDDAENILQNVPVIYRQDEKYICPQKEGWETRYYRRLLDIEPHEIKTVAENYLKGLEWVYLYYTGDCPDWGWRYKKRYGVLLRDIEIKGREEMRRGVERAKTAKEQLEYVLGKEEGEKEYQWAFSRYLWEIHPKYEED